MPRKKKEKNLISVSENSIPKLTPIKALQFLSEKLPELADLSFRIFEGKYSSEEVPSELEFICDFLEVNHAEALVLLVNLEYALKDKKPELEDFSKKLNLTLFGSLILVPYLDNLVVKNYLSLDCRDDFTASSGIMLNNQLIKAISANKKDLLPQKRNIENWRQLARQLRRELRMITRGDLSLVQAIQMLRFLKASTDHFEFWKPLETYPNQERLILLCVLHNYFFEDNKFDLLNPEYEVLVSDYNPSDSAEARSFIEHLSIYQQDLISILDEELIKENNDSFLLRLTDKGKRFFFGEEEVGPINTPLEENLNLLLPRKIKEVKLFYSKEKETDINTLNELLAKDSLEQFFHKMEKRNLPSCLSILLSGGPGTGKTELVLQLARKTGRPILKVDLSAIKDKWVGESEKNVRAIFRNYEKARLLQTQTPILLLNEADGLLSKRREVNSSVDQMHNTMQAILLEQMESMKGIIIATTNMRSHFDEAFDRRFTFKLEFENPCEKARLEIINSLIPEVKEEWKKTLAVNYELSGGQWRNVVYRAFIEEAMGHELTIELLERLAASEAGIIKKKNTRPIGFHNGFRQVA